ncbi:ABC transporter substrate-binding protein [Streptomyces sp. NPDC003077]|uniref:ABC transporter substrate-binding protein n=1 Tax=Streptomyces sp. NPDC003077 TaxID=3154443 RepID=UPI0033B51936
MTHHVGTGNPARRKRRCAALLAAGVLLPLPVLAGCGSGDDAEAAGPVSQDIAAAPRGQVRHGGILRWAVDAGPATLNAFQADADAQTARIAGAVLPALFTLDARGRPQRNADYLEAADLTAREPRQVVTYKINPKARWSDGRPIGLEDFRAQWQALRGKDNAYWTARNAGYDRIARVERGEHAREVKVTFARPHADWRSLFTPLYPKDVMGAADAFNQDARRHLKVTAGPFALRDRAAGRDGTITLVRDPKWWGAPAKLDELVLRPLAPKKRAAALLAGTVDLAPVDPELAREIDAARRPVLPSGGASASPGGSPSVGGPPGGGGASPVGATGVRASGASQGASSSRGASPDAYEDGAAPGADPNGASGSPRAGAEGKAAPGAGAGGEAAPVRLSAKERARLAAREARRKAFRGYTVRKALEPAYTQLAINGAGGPLADDRVRRAVARTIDREALAAALLKPLGLPAQPLGSHLMMAGQMGYEDHSGALGKPDTVAARGLLADAGWNAVVTGPDGTGRPGRPGRPGREASGSPAAGHPDAAAGGDKPRRAGGPGSPLLTAGTGAADAQRAALLRQSAALYQEAAREQEELAYGYTDSAEYARYLRYEKRAARALHAAQRIEAARGPAVAEPAHDASDRAGQAGGHRAAAEHVAAERAAGAKHAGSTPRSAADRDHAEHRARPLAVRKNGKPLTLRFVLPDGPDAAPLRAVGDRISAMLAQIGVRTVVQKVPGSSYFDDHIAAGDYDLALYTWPGTAYPATDARPIYAKPQPAPDGSLTVEQNYTRVGTDHIDQLFSQAASELDEDTARELVRRADARIWAAAGSVPLYQRPELFAARRSLVNAGAFGLATPRYQDMGYRK